MKAWIVGAKEEFCGAVVFAETRGKAKYIALQIEYFEDCEFLDIEARRKPCMDKYYRKGKTEMDWENPKDRIALVKECGFRCEYSEPYFCDDCPAKQFCGTYEEYIEECEDFEKFMEENADAINAE